MSTSSEISTETALRFKAQQPEHWKRWYFLEHHTRYRWLVGARRFFFLIYPAWVLTHLDFYKPDEERIRKAFLETELSSLHSPYARVKILQAKLDDDKKDR